MQNFKEEEYFEILLFIIKNDLGGTQILFFITYVFLLDFLNTNIQNIFHEILKQIINKINILGIIFCISFIYLVMSIYFAFFRNINNEYRTFIQMKKIFRVCNISE